ncbi:hypothetical protein AB0G67_40175 [Streptomyces sp. NPDC021056]|uniref:hypothetical protein n=1 Tax=Streptomyces sp. NPDC021056 TaxID=3155012 RepID=UPI0033F64B0F
MRTRTATNAALVFTLVAGAVLFAPDRAHAAGPVTSGTGWKINAPRITHIDTKPWTIAFHDTASRSKLTPYLKNTAAELSSRLGVTFTVTTRIVPITRGECVTGHTISYRYMSKPDPAKPTSSFTGSCGNTQHAADGAYVYINSDYWRTNSGITEPTRMNVIWHESGHAVGLGHPNTCPRDKTGKKPLMCASGANGYNDLRTRRYTTWEATGLRRLVTNRAYAAPALPKPISTVIGVLEHP